MDKHPMRTLARQQRPGSQQNKKNTITSKYDKVEYLHLTKRQRPAPALQGMRPPGLPVAALGHNTVK
jgi:hypothetical protein